jgi:hypothetical protein
MKQSLEHNSKKDERQSLKGYTPGVNFINIFCAPSLYKSALRSFSLLHFGFIIFWRKDIGKKRARKMLMKLTPELSFFSFSNFFKVRHYSSVNRKASLRVKMKKKICLAL